MSDTDIAITIVGLIGMLGCGLLYYAGCRLERRQRLLTTTGATRLLDGERFPLALDHYEGDV